MANEKTQAYLANLKKTWPLDAKPTTVQPVATTPKPVVTSPVVTTPKTVTTPAKTWDATTQAQTPVSTVTPVTPTPTPTQPTTTQPTIQQTTPQNTQQYTQPATQGKTKIGTPLDVWIKNTQTGQLDYQTPDEARLQQIQQNLTQYSQTSPEMFKDRASFDANFNYGTRSTEQRQVLDNFYKEYQLKQGNPDFVYQTLMNGGSIDPKYQNSTGFQQGYQKYQKIWMFGSMDAKQLATQLWRKLIVWSTEWQELSKINPQLTQDALQEKKKLDAEKQINGTYADMTGIEEWRIQEVDVVTEALGKLYDKLWSLNIDIAEEYKKNVLENPVINDRYVAMEQRASKIAELQSIRDRAIDDAYASAWWAPDSVIRARANMQYKALNNQIALMQSDQEIDQAMLDTDIKRFEGMYNAKIDEYNQEVAQFQEQAQYVTGIAETVAGAYKDQRETKLAEQQAQVQFERDMAMQQAEQEYQMTRDDQAYQRDVQLAQMKYEQWLNELQFKSELDLQSSMTLAQQKAQLEQSASSISQATNNWLSTPVWTDVWMQCWAYANKATGNMWTPWGNNLKERINAFKDQEPVIWWQVLFVWGEYDKTYWHIAVITWVNGDGTINVKESNLRWDNKITERTIPLQWSNISWFYNSTPLAQTNNSWTFVDAVNSLSWSSDKAQQTALKNVNSLLQKWNIEWAKSLLLNNYFKSIWQDASKWVKASIGTIKTMETLSSKIDSIPTSWLKWWFEGLAQKVGKSSDPQLASLAVEMNNALDIIRRWRSGAALTKQEVAFYNSMFPSIDKWVELNKAVIDGLKKSLQQNLDNEFELAFWADTYNNIWKKQTPPDPNAWSSLYKPWATWWSVGNPLWLDL